jgi:hypothetical protein
MDTSQSDDKIKELEKKIIEANEQLEIIRVETCDLIRKIAIYWFNHEVETCLTSNPERAKSYGVENLRILKSDLSKLIESTSGLIEKHVNVDRYWAHCRNNVSDPYQVRVNSPNEFPNRLYDALREIFGYVAPILEKHGFSATGYSGKKYESSLLLPEEMNEALSKIRDKYEDKYREWRTLNYEILSAKKKKKR